jgi:hypothetical protein
MTNVSCPTCFKTTCKTQRFPLAIANLNPKGSSFFSFFGSAFTKFLNDFCRYGQRLSTDEQDSKNDLAQNILH